MTERVLMGANVVDPRDEPTAFSSISQHPLYSQYMLTIASRLDVMNRLGRAMADPTRSRILLSLLDEPGHPAQLARDLDLTRSNVSNHLSCLRGCGIVVAVPEGRQTRYEIADPHLTQALSALVDVVLAVDDGEVCTDDACDVPFCCGTDA
jgi:DNA-binding transcriptional ArsR family regulator